MKIFYKLHIKRFYSGLNYCFPPNIFFNHKPPNYLNFREREKKFSPYGCSNPDGRTIPAGHFLPLLNLNYPSAIYIFKRKNVDRIEYKRISREKEEDRHPVYKK